MLELLVASYFPQQFIESSLESYYTWVAGFKKHHLTCFAGGAFKVVHHALHTNTNCMMWIYRGRRTFANWWKYDFRGLLAFATPQISRRKLSRKFGIHDQCEPRRSEWVFNDLDYSQLGLRSPSPHWPHPDKRTRSVGVSIRTANRTRSEGVLSEKGVSG